MKKNITKNKEMKKIIPQKEKKCIRQKYQAKSSLNPERIPLLSLKKYGEVLYYTPKKN
jgi:hypothetical protein